MPDNNNKPGFFEKFMGNTRDRLASKIVNFSVLLIVIMLMASFIAIYRDGGITPKSQAIKDIFTMLLPVIGTWIGTVIAFYFSRENFQAAGEQAKSLAQLNLPTENSDAPAIRVMQLLSDNSVKKLFLDEDNGLEKFRNKKLKSEILDDYLKDARITRLPILDSSKKIIYVIHQASITNFMVNRENNTDLTIRDLLESDKDDVLTRFATASIDDKLSDVKAKLDKDPCCKDVFITLDGSRDSPAVGWITNVRLEEYVTVK